MSDLGLTLIRSKLLVPSPTSLLHRPRVCQIIERGLESKLTLVSAPAGYGKTSALVDFALHCPVPSCWYTADERDADLGTFITYVASAIAEQFPGFDERIQAIPDLVSDHLRHDPASAIGVLVNGILELDTPFVVIIDNYDTLDRIYPIRQFIRRFLEVLPFNCHLMLASRMLPDVPITHLVSKRQLVGLSTDELRFTGLEIKNLLALSHINLSQTQAEAVADYSEGWITGVLLLADLLAEGSVLPQGIDTITSETYDYLAGEVLERQPNHVQQFLYTSAILREMSPYVCRRLLDVTDADGLLTEVERRHLFITRFGQGGSATYRYHSLFRDFLHHELRRREPTRHAKLHLQAGQYFDQEGDVEEAVYHYLAAESHAEATRLMERVTREWYTRGRIETLLDWAESLPENSRHQTPRLAVYHAMALTERYEYRRAEEALAYAETGFFAQKDNASLAWVHNQRAAQALYQGRYEEVIPQARMALEILEREEAQALAEAQKSIWQAEAQRLIGKAHVGLGHLSQGIVLLQEALTLYRQVGSPYDSANLLQDLASAFIALGQFDDAAVSLGEALAIARRLGASTLLASTLNDLGYLNYLQGRYEGALGLYEEGLVTARLGGDLRQQTYISIGLADLHRDIGACDQATIYYNSGWRTAQESDLYLTVYALLAQADMFRWQANHVRALALLDRACTIAEDQELDSQRQGLLPVARGITLAESSQLEDGLRLLKRGIQFLEQQRARRDLARARFLLAKAQFLTGDRAAALTELRAAMALATEIGTYQPAAIEGQHVEELLALGVEAGISDCDQVIEFIKQLRAFSANMANDVEEEKRQDTTGRLEIYTLGEERVVRDGHPLSSSEWRAAMAKEMFFYILLEGPLERNAIGLVFWPDLSPKQVSDSFHTTLYRIRRAVGADAIVQSDGTYGLGDVDYWFDVTEFESLIERARLLPPHDWQAETLWRQALELYKGDFLPEVERVWCLTRREALREKYVEALIGLGLCHEARREFEEAITWYKKALETDPLREDAHRKIMTCYVKIGRRAEALAQYHDCQHILQQELAAKPSAKTDNLYKQIINNRAP